MKIRDRIRELRRVRASLLRPNPKNWRTHPAAQRDALQGVLAEVGFAGALIARELDDGTLELIDGHLRAETTPDMEVPVLVLDVNEAEAAKLLAVIDPLAAMAETSEERLAELVADVETQNSAVRALLDELIGQSSESALPGAAPADEVELRELFQVVVQCSDEAQQRSLFDRLSGEGLTCRLLVM